ncbi:MAG: hypothetical protein ACRC7C_14375 [Beijerinckiaceae bacterium]
MANPKPPKGGVVESQLAFDVADEAARTFAWRAAPEPKPAPPPAAAFGDVTAAQASVAPDDPTTLFQFMDRGWRPWLGVVCGLGFFYSFVAAPMVDDDGVEEAKLWVLATVALGLAGVKTAERNKIGMPQGLIGGPALVTR